MKNETDDRVYDDIVSILINVWDNIDWDKVDSHRRKRIYDEFCSKIRSSALTGNMRAFIESLCSKMGVRSLSDTQILNLLKDGDEYDMLRILRDETQYLILLLREKKGTL